MAHTNSQKAVLEQNRNIAYNRALEFLTLAKQAREAVVKLPHTSEDGPSVIHGDNLDMLGIASNYAYMAQTLLHWLVTREQERELKDKFPGWQSWIQ